MSDFVYHNKERKKYAIDFSPVLSDSESLSSPVVKVYEGRGWEGTEVTNDIIGTPAAAVDDTTVVFWLDGELDNGYYSIEVQVTATGDGTKTLIGKKDTQPFIVNVIA